MNLHEDLLVRLVREDVLEEQDGQVAHVGRRLPADVVHRARKERQFEVGLVRLARLESRFSVDSVEAEITRHVSEPDPDGDRALLSELAALRPASLVSSSWRSISASSEQAPMLAARLACRLR